MARKEGYLKSNNRWMWMLDQLNLETKFFQVTGVKSGSLEVVQYSGVHPLVVGLFGSDGSCDHAIVVCDGWIFNGAYHDAIRLTGPNLNRCCSSTIAEATFVDYHRAYILKDFPNKKKVERDGLRCFYDDENRPMKKRKKVE